MISKTGQKKSSPESLLWGKIKEKALGVEFHREIVIDGYNIDFYCPEIKLAIEIDGTCHTKNSRWYEGKRQLCLRWGINYLRFTPEEARKNLNGVEVAIQNYIYELRRQVDYSVYELHPE